MKRINILESQYNLLQEGLSDRIFHFTSLNHGYQICKSDEIKLQSAFAKDADNYDNKRKYYLSLTRMRNVNFGYSKKFNKGGVRIEFDGNALAQNYKGKPINYWKGLGDKYEYYNNNYKNMSDIASANAYTISRMKKENPNMTDDDVKRYLEHNFSDSKQTHVSNESEDRLFSYQPTIPNISKYIVSVDVLLPQDSSKTNVDDIASAFMRTELRSKIKVYSTVDDFNSMNGKCYDMSNIQYKYDDEIPFGKEDNKNLYKAKECLTRVVAFIAYGNKDFEGKKFGQSISSLLDKYGLGNFKFMIPKIQDKMRASWGYNWVAEGLDAVRRDMSDTPSDYTTNILKMMTDYFISIGANSFVEGIRIKKQLVDEYYNNRSGASYNFDTFKEHTFLVNNGRKRIVSLYPDKDLFRDVVYWDDDDVKSNSYYMAQDIMGYDSSYNHSRSNNETSMMYYLRKLFSKGTVNQVLQAFNKIGLDKEYLRQYDIDFENVNYSYYDLTSRYATINSSKADDYMKSCNIRDKEVSDYLRNIEKVSKS